MPVPLGIDLVPVVTAPREGAAPGAATAPAAGETSFQDHLERARQIEPPAGAAPPPRPAARLAQDQPTSAEQPVADQNGSPTGQSDAPPPSESSDPSPTPADVDQPPEATPPADEVVLSDEAETPPDSLTPGAEALVQANLVAAAQSSALPLGKPAPEQPSSSVVGESAAEPKRGRGRGHSAQARANASRPAPPPAGGAPSSSGKEKPVNAAPSSAPPAEALTATDPLVSVTAVAEPPAGTVLAKGPTRDAQALAEPSSARVTSAEALAAQPAAVLVAASGEGSPPTGSQTGTPAAVSATPAVDTTTLPQPAVLPPEETATAVPPANESSNVERPRRPTTNAPVPSAPDAASERTAAEAATSVAKRAESALASVQILAAALPSDETRADQSDLEPTPRTPVSDGPPAPQRSEPTAIPTSAERARTVDAPPASSGTSSGSAHGPLREAERVRLIQRVSRAFETALERGSPLRLRLSPPELGSVRLELQVRDGKLQARVEAETPAAQAVLLDNVGSLRERLHEHQLELERFEVELRDPSSGGRSTESDGRDARGAAEPRDERWRNARGRRALPGDDAAPRPPAAPGLDATGRLNVVI